jgi:uncharacterized membrane protein YraQ (UPF0718 family)
MMDFSPFGGFNWMFTLVPVLVIIIFAVVIGGIIFTLVKNVAQWHENNNSPVLTVDAKVTAKRMDVNHRSHHHHGHHRHHHHHHHHHSSSTTYYYATFEVQSGDRVEFSVSDREYGMLAEGDTGKLTFQGTRYKGFERVRVP